MYYAICDCDNCFVSCERVFRPDLAHRPIVVLSNNDGCVVARSREVKELGIKMGVPYYQIKEKAAKHGIITFSSNYELYADMTARVMSLIRKNAPAFFRYSIDEAFCVLSRHTRDSAKVWGENLSRLILKGTGMPVSIGIARTKTLAKIAVHFAKQYPGYNRCCVIDSDEQLKKALSMTPISDVWGIGRRLRASLDQKGIRTALDFAEKPYDWIAGQYNISVQRTWRELSGQDCIPDEDIAAKKSIMTSRSFENLIGDLPSLRTLIANFAARGAQKLRRQRSVASIVGVYIVTNRFRNDLDQYGKMIDYPLHTPTDSTIDIISAACEALERGYRPGYLYKKAGVMLMGITGREGIQPDLFEYSPEREEKLHRLDSTIDIINRVYGRDTIISSAQHYHAPESDETHTSYTDMIRHDHRSPNPSTRWDDIIQLK